MSEGNRLPDQRVERRMWCDDFDTDLPKVVPEARQALGEHGNLELVTHGHETHGALNHPSVWNHQLGMVSLFWRPGRWAKPAVYWTDDPPVHCTLWEALRDAWVHSNVIIIEGKPVFDGGALRNRFEAFMWHVRGWRTVPERELLHHKVAVLDAIVNCDAAVREIMKTNP